jgi:hypothetical protein
MTRRGFFKRSNITGAIGPGTPRTGCPRALRVASWRERLAGKGVLLDRLAVSDRLQSTGREHGRIAQGESTCLTSGAARLPDLSQPFQIKQLAGWPFPRITRLDPCFPSKTVSRASVSTDGEATRSRAATPGVRRSICHPRSAQSRGRQADWRRTRRPCSPSRMSVASTQPCWRSCDTWMAWRGISPSITLW